MSGTLARRRPADPSVGTRPPGDRSEREGPAPPGGQPDAGLTVPQGPRPRATRPDPENAS